MVCSTSPVTNRRVPSGLIATASAKSCFPCGPAVRTLQIALRERGHTVDVDGSFGVGTYRELRKLQADQGLIADGLVGPQTWEKLSAPP